MTPAQLAKNLLGPTPGVFGDNLLLSQGVDTDHDINVGVGACGDSTGVYMMRLFAALIKQIDSAFSEGTNAGGMFTGAVAATTWYHVHLIRRDSDGHIDAGFDTSPVAANRPVGYTAYCRIGAVFTDGSTNIIAFFQIGDTFLYKAAIFDVNGVSVGTSAVPLTLATPLGVIVAPIIAPAIVKAGETPTATWASPSYTDFSTLYNQTAIVAGLVTLPKMFGNNIFTDTSSQVCARSSSASSLAYNFTYGWIDPRGKVAA
jgi:hypothetical protein